MSFDPTKPVQTRDGRPAQIIATDCIDKKYPIVALVKFDNGEGIFQYTEEGRLKTNYANNGDLVNVPVKHTRWANIYNCGGASLFHTRKEAENCFHNGLIARIQIEFTEGEGL